jgi:hypothetical protein
MSKKFHIQTFAGIEIPFPTEKVNKQKKWIQWGNNNLYPTELQKLMVKSSLHSSLIKSKAMFVAGQGWDKTNMSPIGLHFLSNVWNKEDMDEILAKIGYDLELYAMFYLNVRWSKDGESISEISYIDPAKVRVEMPEIDGDTYENKLQNYWVSDGWEDLKKYPPVLYQGFSTTKKKQKSQILQVVEYRPGVEYYGRPEYEGAIRWIEIQYRIGNFHLNNIARGMVPNMRINFVIPGEPTDEEITNLVTRTKAQYEGDDNGGETVITISPDKDSAPTFEPMINNNNDGRFLLLNEQATQEILNVHRVTDPELFSIKIPGELGGSNDIYKSMELFNTQYVDQKQQIIEKIFNWFGRINGIPDKFVIKEYSPNFNKNTSTVEDLINILTAEGITPEQKYHILVSMDYTHTLAMELTGFKDGNNSKNEIKDNTNSVKQSKFSVQDIDGLEEFKILKLNFIEKNI